MNIETVGTISTQHESKHKVYSTEHIADFCNDHMYKISVKPVTHKNCSLTQDVRKFQAQNTN